MDKKDKDKKLKEIAKEATCDRGNRIKQNDNYIDFRNQEKKEDKY